MPGVQIRQQSATAVTIGGADAVNFAGCNYLGLAHDPRVLETARSAIGRFGMSTSASRETSGNTSVHAELETELAAFIARGGCEGLLLPDGFTANLAAAQGLAADHCCAVIDERGHRSLHDAARVAGLPIVTYPHRRADVLGGLLADLTGPAAVMTDGVFTADGGVAPIREIAETLRPDDTLVVDDCHGFCVLGECGRGTCDGLGVGHARLVVTTTLAKGLGCGGGVVVGSSPLIETIRVSSTAYVCTTPVSPVVASAALESLRIVRAEPARLERLRTNAALLRQVCVSVCGDMPGIPTPIVAFVPPTREPGSRLAQALLDRGVYVPLISYPGGPGVEYFRASVTSEHSADQIGSLGRALADSVPLGEAVCAP